MQAFPLDDRGRRYVLDLLAEGLTLAKAVRRRLDLGSSGRCFALVEEALTEQQIYEFQWGKLMSASDGDESAAQLVRDALQAPGRLFLGESADMKADYPALKSWPPITFALHEDVYVGLDAQQAAQPLLMSLAETPRPNWP
mgnify:CR=1 FL=1